MRGIEENRIAFREELLPRFYSGRLHLILTVVILGGLLAFSATHLAWTVSDVLWLCGIFLVMDLNSYFVHKYSLHRKGKGYWFHTVKHHGLFVPGHMGIDQTRDYYMILFPPALMVFITLVFIPCNAFLISMIFSEKFAWLYASSAYLYYLLYELIHLSAHTPDTSRLRRIPVLRTLIEHHTFHHNPRFFEKNLGIVTPLGDYLFDSKLNTNA